ncbi:endoglucanase 14-like [Tasmannia lanceolata]|uniref:endoglucanase 14-like n=1 Tax=Tasmannia lanceolata TaxID=3420 RepID=UPI00406366FC
MASTLFCLGFFLLLLQQGSAEINYSDALTKSIMYFEAQRSGKLPSNQRVQWRGDSALGDGKDSGVNLVGGYYDAGDDVKFGFPMAFSLTLLSWGAEDFGRQLLAKNELSNLKDAIKWGTDYLMNAHPEPDVLYGEVGDGNSDHACWQRPEDMSTPRTSFRIDDTKPGSDLAGETAAAMAAAFLVFNGSDNNYAATLITHAKQLFDFARNHVGKYTDSITAAKNFYSSSGYDDELLWAAAWLYRTTGDQMYLDYLAKAGNIGGTRLEFSWDDKFVGVQTLVAKMVLEGKVKNDGVWGQYKSNAEQFICSCIQKGNSNVRKSPGGLLWWRDFANLQYVGASLLVASLYSDYLSAAHATLQCPGGTVQPSELISFAQSQVEYILGTNPKRMSYMVGFGANYPLQVHHRAASIVSIKKDPTPVTCKGGFDIWFNRNAPNPNVLVGAIVGGPDSNDAYTDSRSNFNQAETATTTNAPFVGVLARIA